VISQQLYFAPKIRCIDIKTTEMASNAAPATCKVVLANGIATKMLAEVQSDLSKLDITPKLVGFLANDDPAAQMYADWSAKTCIEK